MSPSFREGHRVNYLPADVILSVVLFQEMGYQRSIFHLALDPAPVLYNSFFDFLCSLTYVYEMTRAPYSIHNILGITVREIFQFILNTTMYEFLGVVSVSTY